MGSSDAADKGCFYDALGRLTGETGSAARSYTYDRNGNRLTKTEGGTTLKTRFDATDQPIDQEIVGGSTQPFTANVFGDLKVSRDKTNAATTMTYDTAGRLMQIVSGGSTADLLPDALGRIKSRKVE